MKKKDMICENGYKRSFTLISRGIFNIFILFYSSCQILKFNIYVLILIKHFKWNATV